MTALAEKEPGQLTPEELAAMQLDGYIERVEKQVELPTDVAKVVQQVIPPQTPQPLVNNQGQVVMAPAKQDEPEIDLPLSESEVKEGLHHRVADSFRWLAEFCVMLIKKYPGRVFYKQEGGQ